MLCVMKIWQQIQKNYFYRQQSQLSLTADGRLSGGNSALSASDSELLVETQLGQLGPEALSEVTLLLAEFAAQKIFLPSALIPDDFPWICSVWLEGQETVQHVFSNSPPRQRELFERLQALFRLCSG